MRWVAHAAHAASPISAPGRAQSFWRCSSRTCQRVRRRHRYEFRARCVVAQRNARRFGLDAGGVYRLRPRLRRSAGSFDLIVANPPYIRSGEIAALAPDVRDYDPRAALDGGHDGLDCLPRDRRDGARALLNAARRFWWSNSAPAKRRRRRIVRAGGPCAAPAPYRSSGVRSRAPVARKGDSGAGQGMIAKHWETPAKKHLEYPLEPTSLRARNRPETIDAAPP